MVTITRRLMVHCGSMASVILALLLLTMPGAVSLMAQEHPVRWVRTGGLFNDHYDHIAACDSMYMLAAARFQGYRNTIRMSSDGGYSWRQLFIDSSFFNPLFFRVAFPTRSLCLVACDSGRLMRSTDGGETWKLSSIVQSIAYGTCVSMYDSLLGVYSAPPKAVFATTDGGENWKRLTLPDTILSTPLAIYQVLRPAPDIILAIAAYYMFGTRVFRSEDAGRSWSMFPGPENCRRMHFVDTLHGWAVGSESNGVGDQQRDIIYRSTDGGRSWSEQLNREIEPIFGLNEVMFADTLHGIAVGQVGKLLRTNDGGVTWIQDDSGLIINSLPQFMGVAYPVPDRAVAVTNNGDVMLFRDTLPPAPARVPLERERLSGLRLSPNPLASGARAELELTLGAASMVELGLIDQLGRPVAGRHGMWLDAGARRLALDAPADLAPGLYFARVSYNGEVHAIPLRVE